MHPSSTRIDHVHLPVDLQNHKESERSLIVYSRNCLLWFWGHCGGNVQPPYKSMCWKKLVQGGLAPVEGCPFHGGGGLI